MIENKGWQQLYSLQPLSPTKAKQLEELLRNIEFDNSEIEAIYDEPEQESSGVHELD